MKPKSLRGPVLYIVVLVGATMLAGCPGEQFASCQGPTVSHPAGKCSAYYYQTDYRSGSATTQALVSCQIDPGQPGGNVVAFHDLSHGIGLRWLDAHTLEVAVPDDIPLEDKRTADTYNGYALQYVYRSLQPNEPAFAGCRVQPSK
jgi:hypothetical protein